MNNRPHIAGTVVVETTLEVPNAALDAKGRLAPHYDVERATEIGMQLEKKGLLRVQKKPVGQDMSKLTYQLYAVKPNAAQIDDHPVLHPHEQFRQVAASVAAWWQGQIQDKSVGLTLTKFRPTHSQEQLQAFTNALAAYVANRLLCGDYPFMVICSNVPEGVLRDLATEHGIGWDSFPKGKATYVSFDELAATWSHSDNFWPCFTAGAIVH